MVFREADIGKRLERNHGEKTQSTGCRHYVWGLVYGSREVVRHFKQVGGGTLINLGSTVSDAVSPLQVVYSSTKRAVKARTDTCRMELEAEKANLVVTLIKPGPIDTPFPMNAKNYLDSEPKHVPPV